VNVIVGDHDGNFAVEEWGNGTVAVYCGRRCAGDDTGHVHPECATRGAGALAALPELYARLWTLLPPAQGTGARVTGTPSKPIGIRADVHDLMVDIHEVLTSWVGQVLDDHPHRLRGGRRARLRRPRRIVVGPAGTAQIDNAPDRDLAAVRVDGMVSWLAARGDWLYAQGWSLDFAEEIRDLEHTAKQLARLYEEEPDVKLGVPCSRCRRFSLVRWPGDTDVRCGRSDACGKVYRPQEYVAWCEEYARDPEALDPSERAAELRAAAATFATDRRTRRQAAGLRAHADKLEENPMATPTTARGVAQYDGLPADLAVAAAWSRPGNAPEWHERAQQLVRAHMPVLGRALDRIAVQEAERLARATEEQM
jgi:hypothetical protein